MTGHVGIIGVGASMYERTDRSLEELVHQTARRALDDAELERSDLDSVVACASDLEDGRAISSMVTAGPSGSYNRDFIKTTDSGIHALGLAAMRVESGVFDTSLVISWAKSSETDLSDVRRLEADPFYRRETGLGHLTGHATQATGFLGADQDVTAAANRMVEKNTRNRRANPRAPVDGVVTTEEASVSPVVAWPLREAHIPPSTDGACALVVAHERMTNEAHDPVWIDGVGWETDTYNAGNRPFGELPALTGAAEMAYSDADVERPRQELGLAEIHARSAYHELMAAEALGLSSESAASEALEGRFDLDGDLPVTPGGGAFGANPLIATGLFRVAAATRQVRGDGGDCQVPSVDRALAHSCAGFTDQTHGVAILGGGDR